MRAKIILALFLILIGLGDISEHYLACAETDALLPISYTDEEIGKKDKVKPEKQTDCREGIEREEEGKAK